jgi:PEP-CTERM motif
VLINSDVRPYRFSTLYHWREVMFENCLYCRPAWLVVRRLFLVVLLASVSIARAGNITYSLVNYPVNQTDAVSGGTIAVYGTITTDGTLGAWTGDPMSHIVGGSLRLVTPVGDLTRPITSCYSNVSGVEFLYATPTQLVSRPGDQITFSDQFDSSYTSWVDVVYSRVTWAGGNPQTPQYAGAVSTFSGGNLIFPARFNNPLSNVSGSIASNDPWVIGTVVPEPSTLALLGIGAVSLLAFAWRRQRKAQNLSPMILAAWWPLGITRSFLRQRVSLQASLATQPREGRKAMSLNRCWALRAFELCLVLPLFSLSPSSLYADVICGNYDATQTYSTPPGAGGYLVSGMASGSGTVMQGVEFTVPGTVPYSVSTIVSTMTGAPSVPGEYIKWNISPDNSGAPDLSNSLVGFLSDPSSFPHPGYTAFFPTSLILYPGQSYWFTAYAYSPSNVMFWLSSPGHFENTAFSHDGTTWVSENDDGVQHIGAPGFEIMGTPVPEPSTLALLGIGVVSLLAFAWRRRGEKP